MKFSLVSALSLFALTATVTALPVEAGNEIDFIEKRAPVDDALTISGSLAVGIQANTASITATASGITSASPPSLKAAAIASTIKDIQAITNAAISATNKIKNIALRTGQRVQQRTAAALSAAVEQTLAETSMALDAILNDVDPQSLVVATQPLTDSLSAFIAANQAIVNDLPAQVEALLASASIHLSAGLDGLVF